MVSLAFFLSGAAALLFEALWLRRAGLMLGNSVWASSLVLAAFMTGVAIGNALAVRWAARLARPLRAYALLEIAAGGAGAAVVLAAPALTTPLAPLFRALGESAGLTSLVRLGVAFALVLLPTTAMGVTLPVLTRALSASGQDYGRVLGRLYGWNTLGGVLGAVAGELALIGPLGLRGTAGVAAGLNLLAAALAWRLSLRTAALTTPAGADARAGGRARPGPRAWRLLAGAFLAGAGLLALEVIWFRFLQLFLFGTAPTFAFMLAVILLGIGAGGLVASFWLRRDPTGHRWLPAVAALAALATTASYAAFSPFTGGAAFSISQPGATLALSLRLMFATSLLSGLVFTFQGAALRDELGGAGDTTGRLTLANTLGAMTGALVAGFVLLPALGMERSIFAVTALYGLVAALGGPADTAGPAGASRAARRAWLGALAAAALVLIVFPHGAMATRHLPASLARFLDPGTRVVALREGVNQTTILLASEWNGQPLAHRLVTNGHSMSGTDFADRRYMKLFVNWAVAVNPGIRRALLVSYGLGSTAKALTDTRALTDIDIVDTSPEILALGLASEVFPPGASPLSDPRVRVHTEDGRFFLQTTGASFDLITGEPPPPKAAGIVNLYSREFFRLVHDRLTDGGIATYWLPVEELDEDDARAVVRAFCAVFTDCSLWTGAGAHWMLAGTRGLRVRAAEAAFTAQWRDAVVGPELIHLAIETPAQLGATFLADAEQLAPWIAAREPLDDDHPHRLSPRRTDPARQDFIERWMEVTAAAARFERSALIERLWPAALRAETRALFPAQRVLNAVTAWPARGPGLEALRDLLTDTSLQTLPLLAAGSSPIREAASRRAWAAGARGPTLAGQLGAGALARRDYAGAAAHFAAAAASGGREAVDARMYQAFALLMAGDADQARAALAAAGPAPEAGSDADRGLRWLGAMLANP
jgi:predicted membrane-bound spermidine synthase